MSRNIDHYERDVLDNAGKVSKKAADNTAREEYERFAKRRRELAEQQGAEETIKVLEDLSRNKSK